MKKWLLFGTAIITAAMIAFLGQPAVDPEDFTALSKDALYEKLLSAFRYNEFEQRPAEKIAYRGKKPNKKILTGDYNNG